MDKWVITIDGPAGVGKSTVARMLAAKLDAVFLDTGATYRAVTLAAMRAGLDLTDTPAIESLVERTRFEFAHAGDVLKVVIDGEDLTTEIRTPEVTGNVKYIAAAPALRDELVQLQQAFAGQFDRVVTEGRDQGTVVFPNAKYKFFLTADPKERAKRRFEDFKAAGKEVDLETLTQQIIERDASDENRKVGPLKPAADAIRVDTTQLDVAGVINQMLEAIKG
ncbi:MAG: (d)CMP kinase [Planctomycetota bacterium]|jgi:cytidylate kinase